MSSSIYTCIFACIRYVTGVRFSLFYLLGHRSLTISGGGKAGREKEHGCITTAGGVRTRLLSPTFQNKAGQRGQQTGKCPLRVVFQSHHNVREVGIGGF